jgi:hypothetical protein
VIAPPPRAPAPVVRVAVCALVLVLAAPPGRAPPSRPGPAPSRVAVALAPPRRPLGHRRRSTVGIERMQPPSLEDWMPWITLGQSAVTAAIAAALWLVRRDAARRGAIERIEATMNARHQALQDTVTLHGNALKACPTPSLCAAQSQRIAIMEERLGHLPSGEDLARIHGRIDHLSEGLAELRGGIGRIQQSVDLITATLLDHPPSRGGH